MSSQIKFTSFQDASILRKVTIFYFLMSIIPISFLYFLYLQYLDHGKIVMTEERFAIIFAAVVVGVTVGYVALRSMIVTVINITRTNRNAIEGIIGVEKLKHLSVETNDELTILAESFAEITDHLEENVRNLEAAKKTLHSVLERVGEGMASLDNIDSFLELIVETVTEALQSQHGVLLFLDSDANRLYTKVIYGKKGLIRKSMSLPCKGSIFYPVLQSQTAITFDTFPAGDRLPFLELPMISVPLVLHDDVLGIIVVAGRDPDQQFTDEERNLLNNLALQTAVAIENARLNDDAEKTYFETISALALAVEARDPHSRGHSDRVAKICVEVGEKMNLPVEDINTLRDAAKLHDLGKIGIMDNVLKKNGGLNEQEVRMMQKHPEIGEGIIKPIRSLRILADIVRHHHEKLDGSGYPDGLTGGEVGLLVRILEVVDIFDALISDRPYRHAFSSPKAIEELRSQKTELDQKIVNTLAKIVL